MRYNDVVIDRDNRFAIGIEEESRRFYVSIPVRNPYVEYEEYYEITADEFASFQADAPAALQFVKLCREHQMDSRLLLKPGKMRGSPI